MKTKVLHFVDKLNNTKEISSENNLLHLVLQVLLLIYLMFMHDNGYLAIFMPVFLLPGLLFRKIRVNPYYWVLLSMMGCVFYLILDLHRYVPNHKHIFAYVMVAVTIALFLKNQQSPLKFLGNQARYIIGLCFLFATAGKFMAPEFLNGAFFEFTNTTDPRFFGFTSLIGEVDPALLKANESNFAALMNTSDPQSSFFLSGVDNIGPFGMLISYWTIFIEGMIALAFCAPKKSLLSKYRNHFLVIFILTTYPIATVTGFAIILASLGFIQSLKANKLTVFSWFYLLVLVLLPLNKFPFTRLLNLF